MTRRAAGAVCAVVALAASCTHSVVRPPAARPGAKRGGTITVGITEPTSVDPAAAADPGGALIVRTMCDPLIQLDPETGQLQPAIAESWLVSDGGRRFTVKLRKGVRFQDGAEVTSDDAVFSLSRVASDVTASPLASLLTQVNGFPEVHGDVDARDERFHRTLRGLRVISKYSFEVSLSDSQADFLRVLAQPLASPVRKAAAERETGALASRPICAGPYQLDGPWHPGDRTIVLRRAAHVTPVNAGYTAGGRGYADSIRFQVFPDTAAELAEFTAGGLDVAHLPRAQMADARLLGDDLVQAPSPSLEYIGMPTRVPPFDNRDVRLALSLALDRQAIVATALMGAAVPAQGFLPPTLGAVARPAACGASTPPSADVPAARAALARAGVDLKDAVLRLNVDDNFVDPSGLNHRVLAAAIGAQWEAAFGVKVVPVQLPWGGYHTLALTPNGYDGPFRMSWMAPYPSADGYLAPLFSSASIGTENISRFSSPEFDRLLSLVARRAGDEADRRLDYQQLEDIACRQLPDIPLDFSTTNHLVRRSVLDSARGSFTERATGDVALRELFVR